MQHSLRLRIFLMVFVVVAVAIAIVSIFASQGTVMVMERFASFSDARDRRLAISMIEPATQAGGLGAVQTRVEELSQAMDADILVMNQAGRVMVGSQGALVGQTLPLDPSEVAGQTATFFIQNEPAYLVFSYAPVNMASLPPGVRAENVGFPLADGVTGPIAGQPWEGQVLAPRSQAQALLAPFNRSLALAASAGAGVALLLTAVLSRGILGPVEALTAAVRRMEKGDRQQRVSVKSQDEIGELANAFNAMANSVSVSEQLRRYMVSDIAHELRTPLTNMRGYLEAIRDGLLTAQPDVVESLYEETMLLNRLVEDLQDLALVEAGQLRLERQPMAAGDVIEKTVATVRAHSGATGPALAVVVAPDLPVVQADPERVGQVLRNLLSNALHHTPPEGRITVEARAASGGIEVAVSDTGSGIAPEQAEFVFERFYRADPSRNRATGGAGLGLAIVKQLVEAHGGRVWLESVTGKGTTVWFTLPTG